MFHCLHSYSWPLIELGKGAYHAQSHQPSQWRYLPPHILPITSEKEGGKSEWQSEQTA